MDVIPEVHLRLKAIERWAEQALAGECPEALAIEAIDQLSLAARLLLAEGEAA